MTVLRVLHVSDLHLRPRTIRDAGIVLRALTRCVAAAASVRGLDLILVTGDIAFSGLADEYALVRDHFLDPLLAAAGLTTERVFWVPGNHDVNRAKVDATTDAHLVGTLVNTAAVNEFIDSGRFKESRERLSEFDEFHSSIASKSIRTVGGGLGWAAQLEIRGSVVNIAGLDSAWRCSGPGDRGRLLVGERQVDNLFGEKTNLDVRLALLHHPLHWLAEHDHVSVSRRLMSEADVVLSGHLHLPDPLVCRSPWGASIFSSVGSVFDGRSLNGFSIIDLDTSTRSGVVRLFRYFDERREFDQDLHTTNNGEFNFFLGEAADDAGPVTAPTIHRWMPVVRASCRGRRGTPENLSRRVNALLESTQSQLAAAWALGLAFEFVHSVPVESAIESPRQESASRRALVNRVFAEWLEALLAFGQCVRLGEMTHDQATRELTLLSEEALTQFTSQSSRAMIAQLDKNVLHLRLEPGAPARPSNQAIVLAEESISEQRYDDALEHLRALDAASTAELRAEALTGLGRHIESSDLLSPTADSLSVRGLETLIRNMTSLRNKVRALQLLKLHESRTTSPAGKLFRRMALEQIDQIPMGSRER